MMKKTGYILTALLSCLALLSCSELEYTTFDRPFVYYDGASTVNVDATGQVLRTYSLRLSAKSRTEPVNVSFSISAGDGLKEGVDYSILTGSPVSFLPGIYSMPVRIQWLRHPLDESKDNSLTLTLESCDRDDVTIGIPGPAERGKTLRFVKFQ